MDAVAARRTQLEERKNERVRELVQELLGAVSEADRILLVLREIEELSLQDLEKIYQTSQNALKVRLFRARQRSKDLIFDFHPDGSAGAIPDSRKARLDVMQLATDSGKRADF